MTGKQLISKAVGIDLGTTNSAVALLDATDTEVIIHRDANTGGETTPSCVWKDPKSGALVVGRLALRRMGTRPQPIRSVKRLMGSQSTVHLTDEDVSPEAVSAAILREMKRQIEEDVAKLSNDTASWVVDRAIVTVPAYFDQPQIEATKAAAEMAGLTVLDLLHEPTAAACFHCWRTGTQNGLFLVYDLGGGTFDVSVLRCTAGVFEVLGIAGNNRLGGDDLDIAIAEDLRERLIRDDWSLELDVNADEEDALRFALLRRIAESVKIGLSNSGEFLLHDAMGLRDKEGMPVSIDVMFERAELEKLLRPIIERTIPPCFDALEQAEARAGVKLSDVDAIVLAGGSTHVPLVRQIVRENLCALVDGVRGGADQRAAQARAKCAEPVYDSVDTVVARGAAIRAAATGGLSVTNPERTVRVSFRGLGATGASEIHVGGQVEALDAGLELAGGTIRVIIPELDFEDTQDLGQGGTFAFRRLPLQPSAENLLNFEVCDADGAVVATAGRPMTQDRDVRPSGGVDGVAVLSKDISLEVSRAGKVTRQILVPALTSLPHTADHSFLHPGDTEHVRIVLFQQRRKIKELPVDVSSTLPRGTPIALNVSIDKLAYITVKGMIGDVPFNVAVVAPPDREVPSAAEETTLKRQFEDAVSYLPPGQKNVKELEYEEAKGRFEKAAQQGDAAGAVHEYEAMEELVASVEEVDGPLTPPKAFLDNLVRDCLELHQYIDRKSPNGVPYDGPEMVRSIDVQREEAERAFAASDQQAYTDAITMLHNIEDHLRDIAAQVEGKDGTPKPDERQQAAGMVAYGRNKAGKLKSIAEPDRPDLAKELDGIDVRLSQLAGQVEGDPSGVMERARPLLQNLDRIENILQGGRRGTTDLPESSQ